MSAQAFVSHLSHSGCRSISCEVSLWVGYATFRALFACENTQVLQSTCSQSDVAPLRAGNAELAQMLSAERPCPSLDRMFKLFKRFREVFGVLPGQWKL